MVSIVRLKRKLNYFLCTSFAVFSVTMPAFIFLTDKINNSFLPAHFSHAPFEHWSQYYVDPDKVRPQFTLQPKTCSQVSSNKPPFLIIAVISRPNGTDLREAIRKTWGSLATLECGVRLMFVFGKVYDPATQQVLINEAVRHGDILQSNQFDDLYRSSTAKTLQLYQWIAAFCAESRFLARIDDDNWLNLPRYFQFLKASQQFMALFGAEIPKNSIIIRDPNHKYYLPREEYHLDFLPGYVTGTLFTVPTRILPMLLYASTVPHRGQMFLDDVYISGILAHKIGLKIRHVPGYELSRDRVRNSKCLKRDQMCLHYRFADDLFALWNDTCHSYQKLC